jgi:hypothetical protein
VIVLLVTLTSCSNGNHRTASPAPEPTVATTAATPSSSSSTTTVVVTTTTTSRATTTTAALSPEATAQALYTAWTKGDRAAAARVAQPQAVTDLFARPWQAGDGWSFGECSGAAGSLICGWRRPSGQELLLRVQNVTGGQPVTVSEVRFQP